MAQSPLEGRVLIPAGSGPAGWREPAGVGRCESGESEKRLPRAALKLAPPPAYDRLPTLTVTKGAQPMSGSEGPGLQDQR